MTPSADRSAPAEPLAALWPGVALAGALAALAQILAAATQLAFGRVWLDALVIAILAGAVLRSVWTPPSRFQPGLALSGKTLLEVAVVLIGANISAEAILAAGWPLLVGIGLVVILSFAMSYLIGRLLGLTGKMALLIAAGNSICGNSAIAAVAPIIGADARDVATSIAFTAILGFIVVLALPWLALASGMAPQSFGVFAGLTVYAVPQVLAATAPISSYAAQVGTFVKLIRVLMLGPLVLAISLAQPSSAGLRPSLTHLVPWFIVGFLAMMTLRSFGLIPGSVLPLITGTATILTLMAMAALGIAVDVRDIAAAGPRVTAAVTLSIIALGAMALAMIRIAGLG